MKCLLCSELENNNKNIKCYQEHYIWILILYNNSNISDTAVAENPRTKKEKTT